MDGALAAPEGENGEKQAEQGRERGGVGPGQGEGASGGFHHQILNSVRSLAQIQSAHVGATGPDGG